MEIGLVDYTILTKFYIDIKIKNKDTINEEERLLISSAEGRYTSQRNINKKICFKNSANTWFIYYEPYVDQWVLINYDPRKVRNTETLLSDGSIIRFYANTDADNYFPSDFNIIVSNEISKLSGNFTIWSPIFLNNKKTGPLNSYKKYELSTSVTFNSDKRMRLSAL